MHLLGLLNSTVFWLHITRWELGVNDSTCFLDRDEQL